jgi:hypothetical protein
MGSSSNATSGMAVAVEMLQLAEETAASCLRTKYFKNTLYKLHRAVVSKCEVSGLMSMLLTEDAQVVKTLLTRWGHEIDVNVLLQSIVRRYAASIVLNQILVETRYKHDGHLQSAGGLHCLADHSLHSSFQMEILGHPKMPLI